jgi:hypothetical protein
VRDLEDPPRPGLILGSGGAQWMIGGAASTKISDARVCLIRSQCGLVVKGLLVGAGCAPCPPRVVGRRHHGSFPGKNAPRIFTIPRATIISLRGSVRMPGGVNYGVSDEYSTVLALASPPCPGSRRRKKVLGRLILIEWL